MGIRQYVLSDILRNSQVAFLLDFSERLFKCILLSRPLFIVLRVVSALFQSVRFTADSETFV